MNNLPITKVELSAAIAATQAVAEAIRELKSVPAGHLYAHLMSVMNLEQFDVLVGMLVSAKLVHRDSSHLLTWTGPTLNT